MSTEVAEHLLLIRPSSYTEAQSLGVDQNLRPSRLHEAAADPRSIGVSEGESINPRLPVCGHRHVQHDLQEAEDPLPRRCLRRERQSNLRAKGVHRHDLLLPLWPGMYLRHRKPLGVLKPAELGRPGRHFVGKLSKEQFCLFLW